MTASTLRKIDSKVMGHHDEGEAGAAISPGEAIEMQADGFFDPMVSAQAAALKQSGLRIAKEDALQGKTVDDAYAAGDRVPYVVCLPGDQVLLLVKAAESIAINDLLVVEGGTSGQFVEAAGTETKFQAKALEAAGTIAAGGELVLCEIL